MALNFQQVQRNVSEIANREKYEIDVLYELMAAYGRSASSITKLRNGIINLAIHKSTSVLQKGVVYFKYVPSTSSFPSEVEKLEQDPFTARYNPRFLIATDLVSFAAKDTKKGNTLETKWRDIDRNPDFFYGWTGDEVVDEKTEAAADRRAADKMKELYFEVEKVNSSRLTEKNSNFRHELNVFFTRLLFCFFAEDTSVFTKDGSNIFTSSIKDFTQPDGSDLDQFLSTLFEALDTSDKSSYSSPYSNFPYVNGSLFDKTKGITIPKFNAQARKLILDCGALSWAEINPDIFGSMFQSIVDEEQRETHGMHYTSVPNIMKTIEPLFLDELRDEFDKNYDNKNKLFKLWERISKIKVFDPACGSGNFLIIAYKELRKLEHAIIDRVFEEDYKKAAFAGRLTSRIDLDNFYGIEIDDFACEVAILSLYIAKHQMNIDFEKQFGKRIELIPLEDRANIVRANAARIDWQEVCSNKPHFEGEDKLMQKKLLDVEHRQEELIRTENSKEIWDEIYVISNPPYQGSKLQDEKQKEDMDVVFAGFEKYSNLDYVACWFYKAAHYINAGVKVSFVSTNSINQGTLVDNLWPSIFKLGIEIDFAFKDFLWRNSARNNAGVMCSVIGMSLVGKKKDKFIEKDNIRNYVNNINAYLLAADDIFIKKRTVPLSRLPEMSQGDIPLDNGALRMTEDEMNKIVTNYPESRILFKKVTGSQEMINNERRWCLWIEDNMLEIAVSIPDINDRIKKVYDFRSKGAANGISSKNRPHQFVMINKASENQLVIPIVTSIRREYIPIGFLNNEYIVMNSALVIYDPKLYVFSILNSKMHIAWVKAFAGKLKSDFRYSVGMCWYSFPTPELTNRDEQNLTLAARDILLTRENHSEKTLAEIYDPEKMPEDLREAHRQNDILVDRIYRQKPYESDEERLADLFALYEKMISEENKK